MAQRLSDKGRLIAIDRDPEAIEVLKARFASFPNVEIVHNTFDNISAILMVEKPTELWRISASALTR